MSQVLMRAASVLVQIHQNLSNGYLDGPEGNQGAKKALLEARDCIAELAHCYDEASRTQPKPAAVVKLEDAAREVAIAYCQRFGGRRGFGGDDLYGPIDPAIRDLLAALKAANVPVEGVP